MNQSLATTMYCIFQGQYFLRYRCLSMPDWLAKDYISIMTFSLFVILSHCWKVKFPNKMFWCSDFAIMYWCLFVFFQRNYNVKECFLCLFNCVLHKIFFHSWNPFDKKIKLFYFFSGNVSFLRQGHYFH